MSGLTRQAIVQTILAGERDPGKLVGLSHPRIQASREEVAKSLEGRRVTGDRNYCLYYGRKSRCAIPTSDGSPSATSNCRSTWRFFRIRFRRSPPEAEPKRRRTKPAKNAPRFELRSELQRITGMDPTRVDRIDVMVAQTMVSEIGLDMSRWKPRYTSLPSFLVGTLS